MLSLIKVTPQECYLLSTESQIKTDKCDLRVGGLK
jgi:hypothetical protein